MHSILERIAAEEEEENDGHYQEEEDGGAHSLKDVCDLRRPAPSPFSSRRVMFENEQVKRSVASTAGSYPAWPWGDASPLPLHPIRLPFLFSFVSQVGFELVILWLSLLSCVIPACALHLASYF